MALWFPVAVVVIVSLIALQKANPYAYYILLRL